MIRKFLSEGDRLRPAEGLAPGVGKPVWIDLVHPTDEEKIGVENELAIGIPTRDEMEEIEISSRLYNEGNATFMTAILPAHADGDDPEMQPVSFILKIGRAHV